MFEYVQVLPRKRYIW